MSVFHLPIFENKALWWHAMTHSSFSNEQSANEQSANEHNERLEFLGDAILTFVSGAYLYESYPERPEGELTAIRSSLVDKTQLCYFANKLKLGDYLRLGKGAQKQGSRQSDRLLSSAFEALIGAYFLDTHQDMQAVRAYVEPMFDAVIEEAIARSINPKSRLQEWAHQSSDETPVYRLTDSSGPDHRKQFVIDVLLGHRLLGRGQGDSKKKAEKAAARAALESCRATKTADMEVSDVSPSSVELDHPDSVDPLSVDV